jgi:hypothetical protein
LLCCYPKINQVNSLLIKVNRMRNLLLLLAFFLLTGIMAVAQVGINNDSSGPDSSAMLDVKSTTKGFLPPRCPTRPATPGLSLPEQRLSPGREPMPLA